MILLKPKLILVPHQETQIFRESNGYELSDYWLAWLLVRRNEDPQVSVGW